MAITELKQGHGGDVVMHVPARVKNERRPS
jgi:hypothetical protein